MNKLSLAEFMQRYKQQLISKWEQTPEQANEWVAEACSDLSMEWFMCKFPNDPECAADDDFQYAE